MTHVPSKKRLKYESTLEFHHVKHSKKTNINKINYSINETSTTGRLPSLMAWGLTMQQVQLVNLAVFAGPQPPLEGKNNSIS